MPQDFDQIWTPPSYSDEEPIDPQSDWTKVFPIFLRTILKDAKFLYTDTLVYVAGSEEKATDWCKRNTDIELHDETNWWWFVITQEAIDGEFSGIRGVVEMMDWDANTISSQPLNGYKTETTKKEEE